LEEELRLLGVYLSADRSDTGSHVLDALVGGGSSESLADSSVRLWLTTAAIEKAAMAGSDGDARVAVLLGRRTDLTDRLATEVSEDLFQPIDIDYDPNAEAPTRFEERLTVFEALLIDIAVAPVGETEPWVSVREAATMFSSRVDRQRGWTAVILMLGGVLLGSTTGLLVQVVKHKTTVSVSSGATVFGLLALAALRTWRDGRPFSRLSGDMGIFLAITVLAALATGFDQLRDKPLLQDPVGVIAGLVIAALATLIWHVVSPAKHR
jgi:hypothetical protein